MLELKFLKILLQISISLLHSVPKYKPKVPNLGGVYMLHEFYGQQTKLMHHTVWSRCLKVYREQTKMMQSTLEQKLHEFLQTADKIDAPYCNGQDA